MSRVPPMSGAELMRTARARRPELPVIGLTGAMNAELRYTWSSAFTYSTRRNPATRSLVCIT